jgi:hypothetical protein
MLETLSEALTGFNEALERLDAALADDAAVRDAVFAGTQEWRALLRYKLVPQLAGEPALVIAVAGGTNTGKSTVFNLLVGADTSPVRATAAATCHPVVAAHPDRMEDALGGRVIGSFQARRLQDPEEVIGHSVAADTLFVQESPVLPAGLILLDTPDVDSIDKANWEVADSIRAAGDVIIAVLTGEKYKDDRVVEFFRHALDSGRIVLPLMNKAEAENDFEIARRQLEEFREDTGAEGPAFILPHNPAFRSSYEHAIPAADGGPALMEYLQSLDVEAVKEKVYKRTVERFGVDAGHFLDHLDDVGDSLDGVADEFVRRAHTFATQYEPAPGAAIGGLFHEFVQARRGPVRRFIGTTSSAVTKGAVKVGRTVTDAILRRATLDRVHKIETDDDVKVMHAQIIEKITRDLARGYMESADNLREPAAHLAETNLDAIDVERVIEPIVRDVLRSDNISDEFREYALRMLEKWWDDHAGRRKVLEALDGVLAVMPAAIALPIAINTGGYGVAETVAVTGPLAEQFLARVIEYQFGDALFDFITPWQKEQQEHLEAALNKHLTEPCLHDVRHYRDVLRSDTVTELRKWQLQCLSASATS